MSSIEQLILLLKAGKKKDSSEIVILIATIRTSEPDQASNAESIVRNWPETQPSVFPFSAQAIGLGGLGVAGVASLPFIQPILQWLTKNVPLPLVSNPLVLLIIVALIGAVAGALYSIYSHKGVVFPEFSKEQNKLILTQYGILNELGFGAIAAATTIWMSVVGLSATPPADPTTISSTLNILSWSVIIGSAVSGWLGARMRSSRLDQSLLQTALAETSVLPSGSENLKNLIQSAPSATAAARLATGKEIVGTRHNALASEEAKIANQLWRFLDESRVRTLLTEQNVLLKTDGVGLTLGMLQGLSGLDPITANLLNDIALPRVASLSDEEFRLLVVEMGVNRPELLPLLKSIRLSASQVLQIFNQLPSNWIWPSIPKQSSK